MQDYKENIHSYLEGLGKEISRRQQLVLSTLGISDLATAAATYSPRQLADLYASTEYTDPATGQSCRGIGGELLLDELSGYLHPQPGSGLVTYGTTLCMLLLHTRPWFMSNASSNDLSNDEYLYFI